MALLDAYASVAEYRSRTNNRNTADDTEIMEQLVGSSRVIEFELRVAPGNFNEGPANEARYFTPRAFSSDFGSKTMLRLVDDDGRQHVISTIDDDGIAVDTDDDGVYDYTVDPGGENWVYARPVNAAAVGEPWDTLELLPARTGATFFLWPPYPRAVRVTGTWGWTAVPPIIKDLVIKYTRDVRDAEEAGAAGSLSGVALKTDTWRLWLSVKQQYGYPPLVVA